MSTAAIVGGSRGFGRGVSEALARAGYAVAVIAREQGPLDETAARIEELGGRSFTSAADACQPGEIEAAIGEAAARFGPLDVVVACTGDDSTQAPFVEHTWDSFTRNIDADLRASFNICQAAVPHLRAPGGCLVVMSSLAATSNSPTISGFAAAKAAQIAMATVLATELAPSGVTVQCLCPEISTEGNVGNRAFARFAAFAGITEDEAKQQAIVDPMVTAADVGAAVIDVAGGRPAGTWRVTGTGLDPIAWVPPDFVARRTAADA